MQIRLIAGILILTVWSGVFAQENELPIKRLEWLIGDWQTRDEQVNGDYVETGPRNCDWGLNDRYIVCRGTGTNHLGKSRDYIWYFNYNHMEERFEMNSLYGDWPRKNLFIIEVSEDNHHLTAMSYFFTEDGLEPGNAQTVIYNGSDQYIWSILNGDPDPETGEPTAGFIDTASRISR
ncbi:MAG TPA: hypothetical protein VJ984_01470 [Xanthomonadales bacterium]|nr:hypothetical protein [Xanthomonadales bacterium]